MQQSVLDIITSMKASGYNTIGLIIMKHKTVNNSIATVSRMDIMCILFVCYLSANSRYSITVYSNTSPGNIEIHTFYVGCLDNSLCKLTICQT